MRDMELTPELFEKIEFAERRKGYDTEQVETFLEQAGTALAQLLARVRHTEERAAQAETRLAEAEQKLTYADQVLAEADRRVQQAEERLRQAPDEELPTVLEQQGNVAATIGATLQQLDERIQQVVVQRQAAEQKVRRAASAVQLLTERWEGMRARGASRRRPVGRDVGSRVDAQSVRIGSHRAGDRPTPPSCRSTQPSTAARKAGRSPPPCSQIAVPLTYDAIGEANQRHACARSSGRYCWAATACGASWAYW